MSIHKKSTLLLAAVSVLAISLAFIGCEAPPSEEPEEVGKPAEDTEIVQLAHHSHGNDCDPDDWHVQGFDPATYNPVPGPSRWANVPGADIEAGETNTQTSQRRRKAMADYSGKGREYKLYHDLKKGMPVNPDANYELTSYPPNVFTPLQVYNGDTNERYEAFNGDPEFSATRTPAGIHIHGEALTHGTAFAQIATQIDALYHFAYNPPGNTDPNNQLYYGGFTGAEVLGPNGAYHLGVEKLKNISTRAIMIDVKRYMNGNEMLPPGYQISLGHLICSLKAQKMDVDTIEEGDVVLINTGWEDMWEELASIYYQGGPGLAGSTPGINLEAAVWLASKHVVAVGSDAWAIDFAAAPNFAAFPHPPQLPPPNIPFPVHHHLIVKNGITHIESMHLGELADDQWEEFDDKRKKEAWMTYFDVRPVPMVGASGSTVMPVAVR